MNVRKQVVIGFLGNVLDQTSDKPNRWERWRPTVCLCQQDDLVINRLELLIQPYMTKLAAAITLDIKQVSPETEVRTHLLPLEDAWDFEEVFGTLHDFSMQYPFDPDNEDYLIHITTGTHVAQICMFLLTESRHLPARLVQTSPPSPRRQSREKGGLDETEAACGAVGAYSIIDLDLSRYDRLAARFQREMATGTSFLKSGIETRSAGFNALIERIEQVAIGSRAPILLTGPTGAGKSQLARRIYELKKARRQVVGPFIEINCATLRGDGAMSTLFGHKRGSFTGALNDRPGLLRSADGGVMFLDEVGELGPDEQAMLLHAIEEKTFLPVGADKEVTSDFQLIAGTNRDLGEAIRGGTFREDLLARLNLWTFRLPSLRERPEDIEPNLDFELERFARAHGRRVTFNREARERFLTFATSVGALWSANFRDLGAAVVRMGTLAGPGRISTAIVDEEIERLRQGWGAGIVESPGGCSFEELLPPQMLNEAGDGLAVPTDYFDHAQLEAVLQVCRGASNLSDAGRKLFGASRTGKAKANDADRLRKYLARFNLDWKLLQDYWRS